MLICTCSVTSSRKAIQNFINSNQTYFKNRSLRLKIQGEQFIYSKQALYIIVVPFCISNKG